MQSLRVLVALTGAVLILSACGKSGGSGTESAAAPEGAAPASRSVTIGVSVPAADHGWTAGIGFWAEQAMAEHPEIDWVYSTALTPDKQIGDIEDMMAQGVDGLVVLATESAPLTPIALEAKRRGIYLVNVDRGFLEPAADVFLEGDNRAFGRTSAEFIVNRLDGAGRIVILRGIPSTVDTDRYEAAMEVFDAAPDVEVLAAQPGLWNREKALEVMQAYLTQFPEIDAVWASDDDMALGAEQAILESGRGDEMWMLGGAGMKDIVKRVMNGDPMYPADVTYPPAMIAAGIHLAVGHLAHGDETVIADRIPSHLRLDPAVLLGAAAEMPEGQRHITLDVQLVTPDNASEFYFPESVY